MTKLARAFAPGRTDGVIAILGASFVFAAVVGLVPSIEKPTVYQAPQAALYAVAGGLTLALLALTDLWLLFGNPSLMRRWPCVLLVGTVPCIGLAMGFSHGSFRAATSASPVYSPSAPLLPVSVFALITFRLAVICCLGIPSIYLRTCTRWRIAPREGQLSRRSMFQTSIGDLMLVTAHIAVTVIALRIIWSMVNAKGGQMVKAIGLAGAVEIACLLALLLIPLAFDLRAPTNRRRIPLLLPIWTAVVGGLAGVVFFYVRRQAPHAESMAMAIFWACFSFGIAVFLCWKLAERLGLNWTTGEEETSSEEDIARCQRVNPRFAPVLIVSLAGLLFFCYQHDVFALLNGESLGSARRLAAVSRFFGKWPGWEDGLRYTWKSKSVSLEASYTTARFLLTTKHDLSADLLLRAIPRDPPAWVHIKTKNLHRELLEALKSLSLGSLELDCDQIDLRAFDEFCRATDVDELTISCGGLTPRHIQSVHHIAGLKLLSFTAADQFWSRTNYKPIKYSPEMRDALRGLPISRGSELPLRIPDGDTDLSNLRGLSGLILVESRLTRQLCEQLSDDQLFFTPRRARSSWPAIADLQLINCPPSKTTIHDIRNINAPWIRWSFSLKETDVTASDLLGLADIPNLVELEVRDGPVDEIFAARFWVRRGNDRPRCRIRSGRDGDEFYAPRTHHGFGEDPVDHLLEKLAQHDEDLERALSELAHSIVRNDAGEIKELDLQWMGITASGLSKLQQLSGLRRLRIGPLGPTPELLDAVGNLFPSLRVLEIPTPWVTDAHLAQISKFRNLTRLQLPLDRNDAALPRPEQIPFPPVVNDVIYFSDGWEYRIPEHSFMPAHLKHLMSRRGVRLLEVAKDEFADPGRFGIGGYEEDYYIGGTVNWQEVPSNLRLSELGVAHLAALQELEYLFLPGFLLGPGTVTTLESLPKLREFHALFSLPSRPLLRRICALDLRSLSVGVADIDHGTRQLFANMSRLSMLQLFVFNAAMAEDPPEQDRIASELRAALPRCEVHIQFLPAL